MAAARRDGEPEVRSSWTVARVADVAVGHFKTPLATTRVGMVVRLHPRMHAYSNVRMYII